MKIKGLLILMAVAVLTVLLASCNTSELIESMDSTDIRSDAEDVIDAILENDSDRMYSEFSSAVSKSQLISVFPEMVKMLEGVEAYELEAVGYHRNIVNGQTTIQAVYKMTTDKGEFTVSCEQDADHGGFTFFQIIPIEKSQLYYTGTLGHMDGADFSQWAVLILSVVLFAFVIATFVDCCRKDIQNKVLWGIIVLVGSVAFTVSLIANNLDLNVNLGFILSGSSFIKYGNGDFELKLCVPVGAVIYWIIRSRIMIKPAELPLEYRTADAPTAVSNASPVENRALSVENVAPAVESEPSTAENDASSAEKQPSEAQANSEKSDNNFDDDGFWVN